MKMTIYIVAGIACVTAFFVFRRKWIAWRARVWKRDLEILAAEQVEHGIG